MAGYILDTDHVSALDRGGASGQRLAARLSGIDPGAVATTIITYEEQMRGWLAYLAALRSVEQQVAGYGRLLNMLRLYCSTPTLPFDSDAADHFQRLWLMRPRVGTMDLKIAAIALSRDAVLLTGNRRHFESIGGLACEDWIGPQ